jgi:hypothetical protein
VFTASATGYLDGTGTGDIGQGEDNPEVIIYLEKGKSTKFNNQSLKVGESITLNNILLIKARPLSRMNPNQNWTNWLFFKNKSLSIN